MARWVIRRTMPDGMLYRSTDPNVLEPDGWVDGTDPKRVRQWGDAERALEYLIQLAALYPQLREEMGTVKVLMWLDGKMMGVVGP